MLRKISQVFFNNSCIAVAISVIACAVTVWQGYQGSKTLKITSEQAHQTSIMNRISILEKRIEAYSAIESEYRKMKAGFMSLGSLEISPEQADLVIEQIALFIGGQEFSQLMYTYYAAPKPPYPPEERTSAIILEQKIEVIDRVIDYLSRHNDYSFNEEWYNEVPELQAQYQRWRLNFLRGKASPVNLDVIGEQIMTIFWDFYQMITSRKNAWLKEKDSLEKLIHSSTPE